MTTLAWVRMWGTSIGAVALEDEASVATFQYEPGFLDSAIQVAPLTMPLSRRLYSFSALPREAFRGLPGLLADSLPDRFGNALIAAWLAMQGRSADSFNAVERLCYVGERGMGALEFLPAQGPSLTPAHKIKVDELVQLASRVLTHQGNLKASFATDGRRAALSEILRVGTSAGGARAKAIIALNPKTKEVRSGQIKHGDGFQYWLLKFDGVSGNKDKELEDPAGFTAIEYAYSKMAKAAGITMTACELLREGKRRHFMTQRFDRTAGGEKLHMQTLAALAHFDYNNTLAYSYEQAFDVIRKLDLPMSAIEQQFRRMVFNVVARNQDDHVKNIAFLMNKAGQWTLAPAYDVTYSYNPTGEFTRNHQMSINGRRDEFTVADFKACARWVGLKRGLAEAMIEEVTTVVSKWSAYADAAEIPASQRDAIARTLRLKLLTASTRKTPRKKSASASTVKKTVARKSTKKKATAK